LERGAPPTLELRERPRHVEFTVTEPKRDATCASTRRSEPSRHPELATHRMEPPPPTLRLRDDFSYSGRVWVLPRLATRTCFFW
jgi:hypothetical protein